MKRLSLAYALACLLAGAAAPAFAQTEAGVADPQAAVPATTYRPPIHPSAAPAPAASPDQAWRAANATVGGRNPMSLTMPGMGGQHDMAGHEMSGQDMHGAPPAASGQAQQAGAENGMQCMAGGHGCGGGAHAGGMSMQAQGGQPGAGGMQCMSGGGDCRGKGCCGGDHAPAASHAAHDAHGDHAGHAGMTMGAAASGQQCMTGGDGKGCCGGACCCAGKPAAGDHAGHAGMALEHGCCDHGEAK